MHLLLPWLLFTIQRLDRAGMMRSIQV